jgi:ligand-binding sensor domain-containing protein
MHKLLNKVLCSFLLLLAFTANSQTYPFANYTIDNGISSGQVLCAFQNSDGVMWFGTSGGGISMFDGKTFEYLTDKEGLADNVVFCIKKDRNGKILIGTNNGLSVYDPSLSPTSKISRFKNYTTKEGLTHNRIFSIIFDENGMAILGTSRGISTYKDNKCAQMKIDSKLDTSAIFHVMRDSQKNLWCSSLGAGVFKYDGNLTINYSTKDTILQKTV